MNGFPGPVNAVAFSRDGATLIGGSDKVIQMRDVATGNTLRVWPAHAQRVLSLSYSQVSNAFASGSEDKTIRLWSAKGDAIRALTGLSHHEDTTVLAHLWNYQGLQALKAGGAGTTAVTDFRNACQLEPHRLIYGLNLSSAYVAAAQFGASQTLLQQLLRAATRPADALAIRIALADTHYQWAQSLATQNLYAAHGSRDGAIPHYQAAYEIDKVVRKPNAAADQFRIATAYFALSQYGAAARSDHTALALFREVRDRVGEGATLNSLGLVSQVLSRYDEAAGYYQQALKISRDEHDRGGEGAVLSNLGTLSYKVSQYDKAIEQLTQAVAIKREVGDEIGTGITLNNLGLAHQALAQFDQANDDFTQALAIYTAAKNAREAAVALNNLGANYDYLGSYDKAISYYQQALAFQRALGNQREVGNLYSNLGHAYFYVNQTRPAIADYEQALTIKRAVGDRAGVGITLGNLGLAYNALGQYDRAFTEVTQALAISRQVKDREGEGNCLNELGLIEIRQRHYQEAIKHLDAALVILREVKSRTLEARALHNLMEAWKGLGQSRLAVFYGKQAVNLNQEIRASLQGLDKQTQRGFLKSKQDTYRELADLLVGQGRLPEAQQVLNLLKDQEYFEFVRRDAKEGSALTGRSDLTPAEADWEKHYREISDNITAIGVERGALLAKATRTPDEDKRLTKLEDDLSVAAQGFQKFLDQLGTEGASSAGATDKLNQLKDSQALMSDLGEMGEGAVALYTIVGENKYRVILTTPDTQKAAEYDIKAADLNRKILDFRQVLQNPDLDPAPLAQELYKILVGPIAKDLDGAKAHTLMWSLDGALRYLPMGALHDGKQYLVERYRNEVFTPASQARLKDAPSAKWKVLGMGVSKPQTGFDPLPGVVQELHGIVETDGAAAPAGSDTTGVVPGIMKLDEEFTLDAMRSSLRQHYSLVHIASHFNFQPGTEADSFLLLGDGSHLSLQQIKSMPNVFSGVELLTLSACNTATGGAGADGKEVEGFGVVAQRQGAKAVLASLWPVSDASTQLLMREFYRLREASPDQPKVEALRQAQVELIHGDAKVPEGAKTARGAHMASPEAPSTTSRPLRPTPKRPSPIRSSGRRSFLLATGSRCWLGRGAT